MEEFSASGFDEFSIEMEDFEVKHTRKFDRIWKVTEGGSICCIPLLHEGVVYFGCLNHLLYAVDAKKGELLWKFKAYDIFMESSPVYWNGMIFAGSYDRYMYALEASTGKLVWKFPTQGEVYHANMPLIHNGVVYFVSFDNNLYAVTAGEGRLLWKLRIAEYGTVYAPTLSGERLYVPTRDGNLVCLTLDGKMVWKFSRMHVPSIPAVKDGRIYIGFEDQNLYCLDMDGKAVWKFSTQGSIWLTAVFLDESIIFPCWDCNIYCIDAKDASVIWKFRTEGSPSYVPPANEEFEVVIKRQSGKTRDDGMRGKRYDFRFDEEENTSTYKSRITYQVSTQYGAKGKYQVDSDEEAL